MTQQQISKRIVADLRQLGIAEGDVIMVHSSFKSLGEYDLNPEIVILNNAVEIVCLVSI